MACYNSQEWKTTKGLVTFCGTDELPVGYFLADVPFVADRVPADIKNKTLPLHIVRYKYKVDGEIQTNDKVAFGRITLLDSLPVDFLDRRSDHPKGERVTVTYDPNNPPSAVLSPSMEQEGLILLGLSVFFVVAMSGSFFLKQKMEQ